MNVIFRKSFEKDLAKLRDVALLEKIKTAIEEVENADNLSEINNVKKLKSKGSYYLIRVGNYRICLVISKNEIAFVRVLHRKEIYQYFP